MTTKEQVVKELIARGTEMSNRLYNMRQDEARMPSVRDRDATAALVREWDAAVSHYHALTKKVIAK